MDADKRLNVGNLFYIEQHSGAALVRISDGQRVELSAIEHRVLSVLVENKGHGLDSDQIADHIYGEGQGDAGNVKPHISRIRTKLDQIQPGLGGKTIVTQRGYGTYTFSLPVTVEPMPISLTQPEKNDFTDCLPNTGNTASLDRAHCVWKTQILSAIETLEKPALNNEFPYDIVEAILHLNEHIRQMLHQEEQLYQRHLKVIYSPMNILCQSHIRETEKLIAQKQEELYHLTDEYLKLIQKSISHESAPDHVLTAMGDSAGGSPIPAHVTNGMLPSELSQITEQYNIIEGVLLSSYFEIEDFMDEFASSEWYEYLDDLPKNRETALALTMLCDSYDEYYLWQCIFEEYLPFLTKDEREPLVQKALRTFELEVCAMWGIADFDESDT